MRRTKSVMAVFAALVVGALLLAACSSSSTSNITGPQSGTKQAGGVATWAESPNAVPNFIFPFMTLAFFGVQNINQFQYLMYRPLYWFGTNGTPDFNSSLSLAQPPVYSNNNQTVTITLKGYKWSNGETVDAHDVMFWLNMLHADKANWAAYAPGTIPDSIKNVTIDSSNQITIDLTKSVNTNWFTYNQLSQITPFPMAWDKTSTSGAPNSGGCAMAAFGTADAACNAVYTFLSKEAGYDPANPKGANNSLSTYATNPLWQVVDGPWHLTAFDASGDVTMKPNPSYSGPTKPTLSEFIEKPFTSEASEFDALASNSLSVGFLPLGDVQRTTNNALVANGNNPRVSSNYYLNPLYTWSVNYFPYNFNSTGNNGTAGPIFNQLYFRQAMQYLIDQPLYITHILKGYGEPTYGPIPVYPSNSYVSTGEKNNPYPYDPSKAKSLLEDHGWTVVPNGTSTCSRPGTASNECGAHIPAGTKLSLQLQYSPTADWITELMTTEKSSWAQVGINVSLSTASFDTVIGNATPCSPGPSCTWELENWGAGWIYAPDYYPTGEEIFQTGAGSNSGSYSDPTNDAYISQTVNTQTPLTQYEDYLAKQLPVVWEPDAVTEMTEVVKNLHGVLPQDPLWQIYPENWYFTH